MEADRTAATVDYSSFREGFLACWVWEYGDSRHEPGEREIRRQYQQWIDSGLAGTTAASGSENEGVEAGVAPGERQDASPAATPKVGEARDASE